MVLISNQLPSTYQNSIKSGKGIYWSLMIGQVKCNSLWKNSINLLKVAATLVSQKASFTFYKTLKVLLQMQSKVLPLLLIPLANILVEVKVEYPISPCKVCNVSFMLCGAYLSLMILLFNLHRSIQNLSSQSFFLNNSTALAKNWNSFW